MMGFSEISETVEGIRAMGRLFSEYEPIGFDEVSTFAVFAGVSAQHAVYVDFRLMPLATPRESYGAFQTLSEVVTDESGPWLFVIDGGPISAIVVTPADGQRLVLQPWFMSEVGLQPAPACALDRFSKIAWHPSDVYQGEAQAEAAGETVSLAALIVLSGMPVEFEVDERLIRRAEARIGSLPQMLAWDPRIVLAT